MVAASRSDQHALDFVLGRQLGQGLGGDHVLSDVLECGLGDDAGMDGALVELLPSTAAGHRIAYQQTPIRGGDALCDLARCRAEGQKAQGEADPQPEDLMATELPDVERPSPDRDHQCEESRQLQELRRLFESRLPKHEIVSVVEPEHLADQDHEGKAGQQGQGEPIGVAEYRQAEDERAECGENVGTTKQAPVAGLSLLGRRWPAIVPVGRHRSLPGRRKCWRCAVRRDIWHRLCAMRPIAQFGGVARGPRRESIRSWLPGALDRTRPLIKKRPVVPGPGLIAS